MAPILRDKAHKEKSKRDLAEKSKVARMRAKHLGVQPRSPNRIVRRPFRERAT